MGCDCCKKVNPADYEKCQQDIERILRNCKNDIFQAIFASHGKSFTFDAKITMTIKKKKRKR